jgi:hypothetical protein
MPTNEEVTVRCAVPPRARARRRHRPVARRPHRRGHRHGRRLCAARWQLVGRGLPTINFRVDYLRPADQHRAHRRPPSVPRATAGASGVADVDVYDEQTARSWPIGRATYATPFRQLIAGAAGPATR